MVISVSFHFFFSSRRRHTRWTGDWSSDVCSSDLGRGEQIFRGGAQFTAGREKRENEDGQSHGREAGFDPGGERTTADARWAVHADARAGLEDWKDRDRRRPRRPRHGNNWPDRIDGERPVPGRGAATGEDYRAAAAGRGCGVYTFGRHVCSAGRTDEHREPGQGGSVYFDSCEFEQGPRGARHRDVLPEPEGLGGGDGSSSAGKRHGAGRRARAAGSGDENREDGKD